MVERKWCILLPRSYYRGTESDKKMMKEYNAIIESELFDVATFGYDEWFCDGLLVLDRSIEEGTNVIYRGLKMPPEQYRSFSHEIEWTLHLNLVIEWWDYEMPRRYFSNHLHIIGDSCLKAYDGKINEFRVFYCRGKIISRERISSQGIHMPGPPEELLYKYAHLSSPFYAVDFAERRDGSWIVVNVEDGQISSFSDEQDYEAFYRALYNAMTSDLEWRWCLVGNIVETRLYGEEKEVRNGTKRFSGGTKVYVAPSQWGDGFENVVVLGKPRGRRGGVIEMVIRRDYIHNFRLQKIYSPLLLRRMSKSQHSWWENTDGDRDLIKDYIEVLNKD